MSTPQLLDLYFGSVCELEIIYNYEKVIATVPYSTVPVTTLHHIHHITPPCTTPGLLHPGRVPAGGGGAGDLQEVRPQRHQAAGEDWRVWREHRPAGLRDGGGDAPGGVRGGRAGLAAGLNTTCLTE